MCDLTGGQLISVLLVVVLGLVWWRRTKTPRLESFLEKDAPKDTVILHEFGPAPFVPSVSPFVIKLETYLRVTGIPYVNKSDRRFGPKGKLPWIQYNDHVIADSQSCIEFLNTQCGVDLNRSPSPRDLAIGHVVRRTVEEFLYWSLIMMRLSFDPRSSLYRSLGLPIPFIWYLRIVTWNRTYGQGIGRHSRAEVTQLMDDDLQAIVTLMDGHKFLFSDSVEDVTECDCALFGQLCQLIWQCPETGTQQHIHDKFPSLVEYCERMKHAFWPDWDSRLSTGTATTTSPTSQGSTSTLSSKVNENSTDNNTDSEKESSKN